MKLPETREKTKRCRALLDMLFKNETKPESFDPLLDAFLGCAREVTWILQSEFRKKYPSMEKWYEEKVNEMQRPDNNLLKYFREVRNFTTKEGSAKFGTETSFDQLNFILPAHSAMRVERGVPTIVRNPGTDHEVKESLASKAKNLVIKHYLKDPAPPFPLMLEGKDCSNFDAVTLCRLYLGYLERLAKEAESKAQ